MATQPVYYTGPKMLNEVQVFFKDLTAATIDTFKRKPVVALLKTALIIAALAYAIHVIACLISIASSDVLNYITMDKEDPFKVTMWTNWSNCETAKRGFLKYPLILLNKIKFRLFVLADGRGIFKNFAFNATTVYKTS